MRSALEQRKLFSDYRSWMVERFGPVALEVGRFLGGMGFQMPVRRPALTDQHLDGSAVGDGHSDKAVRWSTR
jgi:hypothetical protein